MTMPPLESGDFFDVPALLEFSEPRPRVNRFWYAVGLFALLIMLSAYLSAQSPLAEQLVRYFSGLVMMAMMGGLMALTFVAARRQRDEQQRVEAADELVRLRRWPEAAMLLREMLSAPTRSPVARVQALIYLVSVLARYNRFSEAIAVQEYLLEHIHLDDATEHGLRLGRAMALLHEDRLVDADRAISDLRRGDRAGRSAGLALVQIYRDVKTGHPDEAVALFEQSLPQLRNQLGHRVADAYALVARAYDSLGRESEAAAAFAAATLLCSPIELQRRYPEVAPVAGKYKASDAPPGLQA